MAALVAAPVSAVLLMVSDQSLAGMLEGTRVRALIGGGMEWFEEYARYATLLEPGSFQGAIGRRAAVLFTLLAAVGVLWTLRRSRAGIATGPARRLVLGFWLCAATMTSSPTKWTQHFGDLAGYGAGVLVLGLTAWSTAPLQDRPRLYRIGLGAVTGVGAPVLAGYNLWPYSGAWLTPTFSTLPPHVAEVPISTPLSSTGGSRSRRSPVPNPSSLIAAPRAGTPTVTHACPGLIRSADPAPSGGTASPHNG